MICACFAVKRGQKLSKSLRRVFCDTATTMLLYKRGKRSCCSNKKSSLDCPRTKPQLDLETNTKINKKSQTLHYSSICLLRDAVAQWIRLQIPSLWHRVRILIEHKPTFYLREKLVLVYNRFMYYVPYVV